MLVQKCKERRKRDDSKTTPAIHRKKLFEKRGSVLFPIQLLENRMEYMFELLCGIDLINTENLGIDKE